MVLKSLVFFVSPVALACLLINSFTIFEINAMTIFAEHNRSAIGSVGDTVNVAPNFIIPCPLGASLLAFVPFLWSFADFRAITICPFPCDRLIIPRIAGDGFQGTCAEIQIVFTTVSFCTVIYDFDQVCSFSTGHSCTFPTNTSSIPSAVVNCSKECREMAITIFA